MKHLRKDYDRIQDPEDKIGKDEPVFLIRATDAAMVPTLRYWAYRNWRGGGDLCDAVEEFANEVEEWQARNGAKTADAPDDADSEKVKTTFEKGDRVRIVEGSPRTPEVGQIGVIGAVHTSPEYHYRYTVDLDNGSMNKGFNEDELEAIEGAGSRKDATPE